MTNPLLSIVTVTLNDIPALDRTLGSLCPLLEQARGDVEVHVIDGGTERVQSCILGQPYEIDLLSEPDLGIYDAMNKGVSRSHGRYIWFLNGGDENRVTNWSQLHHLLSDAENRISFCAYEATIGGWTMRRNPRSSSYIMHALPTSHQAIFYPSAHLASPAYDLNYRVAGDYYLTASLMAAGVRTFNSNLVVSNFSPPGWSAINSKQLILEAKVVQRDVLGVGRLGRAKSRLHHEVSRRIHEFSNFTSRVSSAHSEPDGV